MCQNMILPVKLNDLYVYFATEFVNKIERCGYSLGFSAPKGVERYEMQKTLRKNGLLFRCLYSSFAIFFWNIKLNDA